MYFVNSHLLSNSILNGQLSSTLYSFSVVDLKIGYPFNKKETLMQYNKINTEV